MAEPEPTTVWMVHLDRGLADQDVRGRLTIEEDMLVFTGAGGQVPVGFPFPSIAGVKRLRGSPVLLIEWRRDDAKRRTAFYFTQPPPLAPVDPAGTSLRERPSMVTAARRPNKRRHIRINARYLQTVGINKKEEIQAWADEVAARMGQD